MRTVDENKMEEDGEIQRQGAERVGKNMECIPSPRGWD